VAGKAGLDLPTRPLDQPGRELLPVTAPSHELVELEEWISALRRVLGSTRRLLWATPVAAGLRWALPASIMTHPERAGLHPRLPPGAGRGGPQAGLK